MLQLEKNKGFAEDLTEGKFSFPIIHGIKSHPENNQIMNILVVGCCKCLWNLCMVINIFMPANLNLIKSCKN